MQTVDTQAQVPTQANTGFSNGGLIDSKTAISIINKRITVTRTDVGSSLRLKIQGTGQFLDKGHKYTVGGEARENMFDRTIYNLRASSAMLMAANKPLFTAAMKAESAGDTQKAHDLFNEFLNAVQLSFSVIEPSNRKFNSGDNVNADIILSVSKANVESLQVDSVSYIAPTVKAATKFEVTDLLEA